MRVAVSFCAISALHLIAVLVPFMSVRLLCESDVRLSHPSIHPATDISYQNSVCHMQWEFTLVTGYFALEYTYTENGEKE